ncbi:hypothetical protein E2320_017694, partial [Naja naja]
EKRKTIEICNQQTGLHDFMLGFSVLLPDSSVIAQPMFVFKKERPCKRPAEDPVHKTENETVCSKKQVRKSSFIIIPSFPPSQPVKKNNVFMTSGLSEDCIDVKATEQDTYAWIDVSKKIPHPLQISSCSTMHNRSAKDRTVSESEHSNFVFGENIVERVLKPEKSPELQSKDGQHISEKKSVCAPDFHTIPLWAIMRNQGSMRLILNTKLWTQMVIERANRKSVCVTATDLEDGSIKVFLIQASTKDIESLYAAIHHRLVALKNFTKQECGINQAEYKLDVQPISCDSDDEENEKRSPGSNNRSG